MPPLLDVRGLVVSYGRLPALRGVDLAVPEGSVVAILGANGAGKTTLLKTVAGLTRPRSGDVVLGGRSIVGDAPHEIARSGVCLIPEGRGVFPALTVADNLRLALPADDGVARERVYEYFPVLRDREGQLAGTLSGGEQQMLALARAIGTRPRVLMADELSLGLAPRLVGAVTDTLRRLHEDEGRTIVLVEQYATHALRLADFVYVLDRGRVTWAGEPAEVRGSSVLVESYLGSS